MSLSRRSFFSLPGGLSALVSRRRCPGHGGSRPRRRRRPSGCRRVPAAGSQPGPRGRRASHGNSRGYATRSRAAGAGPRIGRLGFGDWETCIDAAAHVGNSPSPTSCSRTRPADDFFRGNDGPARHGQAFGLRPTSAIQKMLGPARHHLMSHARAGCPDAAAVVDYLRGSATPTPRPRRCRSRLPIATPCLELRLRTGTSRLLHGGRAA